MTIKSIIRKAVKRLELEGKLLTPDSYTEAFCKEAKKAGMMVEDCHHRDKLTKSLGKEFQKELSHYQVNTLQELARFLISQLNRTNPTTAADVIESQNLLLKRVFQVMEVLHNKEVTLLAQKSLDLIAHTPSATQLDNFRQLWINFLTTYDDTFLQKLKPFGDIDTKDLKTSIFNLNIAKKHLTFSLLKFNSGIQESLTITMEHDHFC